MSDEVAVSEHRATPWRMVMIMGGAGVTHFTNPDFYDEIVPSWAPGSRRFWVQASGVAELACTALLVSPKTRRLGGWLTTGPAAQRVDREHPGRARRRHRGR